MEMQCVFCDVGSEFINTSKLISEFKSQGSEGSQSRKDCKIWLSVPWDSKSRIIVLARASSNLAVSQPDFNGFSSKWMGNMDPFYTLGICSNDHNSIPVY
jgi:hypothetical protein